MTHRTPLDPFEEEVRASFRRHLASLDSLLPMEAIDQAMTTGPDSVSFDPIPVRAPLRSRRMGWRPLLSVAFALFAIAGVAIASSALLGSRAERARPHGTTGPWTHLVAWPTPTGAAPQGGYLAAWHNGFAVFDPNPANVGDTTPGIWFSPDGFTWTRVHDADAVFAHARVNWLVGLRNGFLAVGSDPGRSSLEPGHDDCGMSTLSPAPCAMWFSADGFSWHKVSPNISVPNIDGVAAGPNGVVVSGFDDSGPMIWFSPDGATWQRGRLPVGVSVTSVTSVVAGSGGYVALLDTGLSGGPAIWWSSDGIAWTASQTAADTFLQDDRLESAFVGRDGMVAYDLNDLGGNPPWRSTDGKAWSRANYYPGARAVISDGQRLIGYGPDATGLFQSYDGMTWTKVGCSDSTVNDGTRTWILAISPTGLLAAGKQTSGGDPTPIRFLAGMP